MFVHRFGHLGDDDDSVVQNDESQLTDLPELPPEVYLEMNKKSKEIQDCKFNRLCIMIIKFH